MKKQTAFLIAYLLGAALAHQALADAGQSYTVPLADDTRATAVKEDSTSPKKAQAASDEQIPLITGNGLELGAVVSHYRYHEHDGADTNFMHENGTQYGLKGGIHGTFDDNYFLKGEVEYSYGSLRYSSASGAKDGVGNYKLDGRGLFGKDFLVSNLDLSPYFGLGYRNLLNNLDGTTSTDSAGYRRTSQYLYIPVGLVNRFRLTDGIRLAATAEYDQLVRGWQKSYLSDFSPAYPDLENNQTRGRGFRASVMLESEHWSLGPWVEYWNINQSDTSHFLVGGQVEAYGYEPHNDTTEYGIEATYRF
jgi:hypothetical protein